nr:G-type lectin S-receptor-like serine/threonine-protein kinase RKS1 [Coffea arabica]
MTVSGAKDTLGISESLKLHNGEILESSNKRYRFLSDHSSSFLVIQFVYLNHSVNIWAANDYLDASSRPRISTMSMNESGRLEVYGNGNSDVAVFTVNSKQKVMISKTRATLLDNGNLVLTSRSGRTVWQSFDYPADDTWLSSGMKLGISLLSQRSTTCCLQRAASGAFPWFSFISFWPSRWKKGIEEFKGEVLCYWCLCGRFSSSSWIAFLAL